MIGTFVGLALKVSAGPATAVTQGLAYDAARALVVAAAPVGTVQFVNGLPVDSNVSLFIVDKAAAVAPLAFNAGLAYDASGAVVTVDTGVAAAPLASVNGLTFDASGALVTSA